LCAEVSVRSFFCILDCHLLNLRRNCPAWACLQSLFTLAARCCGDFDLLGAPAGAAPVRTEACTPSTHEHAVHRHGEASRQRSVCRRIRVRTHLVEVEDLAVAAWFPDLDLQGSVLPTHRCGSEARRVPLMHSGCSNDRDQLKQRNKVAQLLR
jgi:hypothetical protein